MGKRFSSKAYAVLAVLFAILVAINAVIFATLKSNKKVATVNNPEMLRSVSYEVLSDDDEYADANKYVKFGAFFTKDLDGDGKAEKILGSCTEMNATDTMYIDIGVEQNGYLKDGVITISGDNFTYSMEMLKDTVLKNNYVSEDVRTIELNEVYSGTQELIMGDIHSVIYGASSFSQVLTVNLKGTHVSDSGDETEIDKSYNLVIDWYSKTDGNMSATTTLKSTGSTVQFPSIEKDKDIRLSYSFTSELKKGSVKESVAEISVPTLAGYYPTSVEGGTYDEENHVININEATSANISTYKIFLVYPKEAYDGLETELRDENEVNLISTVKAYHLCNNNPNEEFVNPYQTKQKQIDVTISITNGNGKARETHAVDTKIMEKAWIKYPEETYAISKKTLLEEYDKDEPENIDYRIYWYVERVNADSMESDFTINDSSAFGDSFDNNVFLQKYYQTTQIAFSNFGLIPNDGWIAVYETEIENGESTYKLVKKFENGEWKLYTNITPYVFENPVKDIRIVTSNDVQEENRYLAILLTRSLDVKAMKDDDMRSAIEEASKFKTSMTLRGSGLVNIITDSDECALVEQKSVAEVSVKPTALSTSEQEPVNQTFKISVPESSISTAEWTNGQFLIEIPASRLAYLNINDVISNDSSITIDGYELYKENNNYYVKIVTSSKQAKNAFNITVDCDILASPIANAANLPIHLYYFNEECRIYDRTVIDRLDINGNGNKTEPVGYAYSNLKITAPSAFVSTESITNYNDSGDINIAPNVALLTKEKRSATVNVMFANNYVSSVLNVKVLGKIPFSGNSYVDGDILNSEFTTTMTEDGITLPDSVKDTATVYYSENENPTIDLTDESNEWKTKDELSSFSNVKTYLVVFEQNSIKRGTIYNLSYDINIPEGISSNAVSYACHKVFFGLNTDGGILETSVQPNKVGLRVVNYYDINLKKYKKGTDVGVQGAVYQILEDDNGNQVNGRIATSTAEGTISFTNLRANQIYYLKEIQAPKSCELNTDVIKFVVRENADGSLSFELLSEKSFDGEVKFVQNESGRYVLTSSVEDIPKVRLTINKVDKQTRNGIGGVVLQLNNQQ